MVGQLSSAVATGQAALGAVAGWLGLGERFTTADGEEHTLTVEGSEERPEIIMASTPRPLTEALDEHEAKRAQQEYPLSHAG